MYASGDGVEQDTDMAAVMFRKAITGGVDARDELAEYVFASDGYSNRRSCRRSMTGALPLTS